MTEPLGDLELLNQADDVEQKEDLSELGETSEEESESTEETTEEVTEEGKEKEEKVEEEPVEEDEAEKLAQGRLTFKEVSTKFPTLFKEFPQLRHAFFREQEYSKVFPTVEDAQEASRKATDFSALESDLLAGNPQNLLAAISQANPQAFEQIVTDFLPTVYSMNKDAFYQVTQPILTNALQAAYKEATNNGDKNLAAAAQYINRFLFGKVEIDETQPIKRERTVDPERAKFEKERNDFQQQRAVEFETDVQKSVHSELLKLVSAGLDPKNELNEFTRNSITEKTIAQIGAVLSSDTRHTAMMNSLWKRAMQSGLTPEYKARIMQAFLGRAKEVLPSVRSKVRSEATGTKKSPTPIKRVAGSGTPSNTPANLNPRKVDWRKTSDLDILNDNVKMK